ncbi:MAG: N-acyl homoserine lactonase family protein [Eggerthellaceae bacterium]|nr:N-acyl homoserine lactonase family protein [Eggerthellaceae bacterium]
MKLYVIDLGKIVMMNDNPVVDASTAEEESAIPIQAFLIDSPAGWVLFDAGCNLDGMDGAWPEEIRANPYVYEDGMTIVRRLADIGVAPEDVKHLVLSHLHLDHVGCAVMFPEATWYVQQDEYDCTMADYKAGTLDMFHLKCDMDAICAQERHWCFVKGDPVELCEGLSIYDFGPGHSFGMLGLRIDLECGTFILAQDTVYSAYHFGPPAQFSGAMVDEQGYLGTIEFIRNLANETNAKVIFGHDMEQFRSLTLSDAGYYE